MTWEYALIGLVVGIAIGAVAMRFGNRKLRQQQVLQNELEKSKTDLEEYRQELVGHFARSAELLDNMARDYRQLYQHMAKSSNNLLPDLPKRIANAPIAIPTTNPISAYSQVMMTPFLTSLFSRAFSLNNTHYNR